MTSKEKAEDLIKKFIEPTIKWNPINSIGYYNDLKAAKDCALIAVNEIIDENAIDECELSYKRSFFWEEVKQEIEKL